jgi:Mrp family chromosome partitioning ATPase
MSKIYEALRRHKNDSTRFEGPGLGRSPIVRALESVYPVIYRLANDADHGLVLHFVAASVGEGASTLSAEFALVAAAVADTQVLLVDADTAAHTTSSRFGCPTTASLYGQVSAGNPIEPALVRDRENSGLQIGALVGDDSAPLSRKVLPALYEQFQAKFDLTIIDCPAVFSNRYLELRPDAVDGVVLIVQAERSRPEMILRAQSLVENAGGKFIGAILNRRHTYIPDWLYRLL